MPIARAATITLVALILQMACVNARLAEKGPWKAAVPDSELPKFLSMNVAAINEAITNGIDDKKNQTKARVAAIMAAGAAQSTMLGHSGKAGQFAAVRDHAIKLAEAISNAKISEAKQLAEELSPKLTGSNKSEPIDLAHHLDLESLMSQFKPEQGGGRGWEKSLKSAMAKRTSITADEAKIIASMSYQIAIISQFTEALAPIADAGKKKKADWLRWTRDMGESSLNVAKVASAARLDDKAIKSALRKLDESCVKCHAVFRD